MSRSDLELSVLHGFTCCNFYVAKVGGRVGRNSNRYCLGYFLQAGLVFAKTPDHYIPNFGHKKAAMFGLQLARLIEFLRSAGNSTPGDRRVNWKNSLGGMRRIGESMRHEFSEGVRRKIAQRAMYICSNPACLCVTGYDNSEGKPRSIAEGAHIEAASENGPRSSAGMAGTAGKEENGIWLCRICHALVDQDPSRYSARLLKRWKKDHVEILRGIVGKDLEAALLGLKGHRRYHEEMREFISFLESRRVLYEGFDSEFPPRVLESLNLIRERIVQTRARVNPGSELFLALNRMQEAVNKFLREIGPSTDLSTLRCDSNDPNWRSFSAELEKLRTGIVILMKVLAGNADYKLSWV